MMSVAAARAILLALARRMPAEQVPLKQCLGRTLAAPVIPARAQPPFAASAMDGYAVRSADTPGRLRIVGEAGAGHALGRPIAFGECARIFTGAPLPDGADAIAIQEEVECEGDFARVPAVASGKHVRSPGLDFEAGSTLLPSGKTLTASALAAAAAAGLAELSVARQPRLAILSGGDEIIAPGEQARASQIFDSVSYGVAGFAQGWGAAIHRGPLLRDDVSAITRTLAHASAGADMTIMIGGASVGEHDHARRAAQSSGAEVLFDKVSVRPGKPTWLAVRDDHVILGLPGNPASALVCARLFLRPFVAAMLGADVAAATATRRARLTIPLAANGPREAYLRASTHVDASGQLWVTPAANQDSSLISVFVGADALVACATGHAALTVGEAVDILSF